MNSKAIRRLLVPAALALAVPASASAHVTVQPKEQPAGEFTRIAVRVPNEKDDSGTKKVEVQFPAGFYFLSYEPIDGWKTKVKMEKLPEPVDGPHGGGEKLTEQVDTVTFTAESDSDVIGPGQFRDFGLSTRTPEKPGDLRFKALQTYEDGEVVRWIEDDPEGEKPAATLTLAASEEHGGESANAEAAAAPASGDSGDGDDGDEGAPTWLAVVALGAGLLGLVLGGLAFSRSRGTSTA